MLGGTGGTVLWQASDLLISHVVKFDGSIALVCALHDLPFDFSLLQLKKNLANKTAHQVVEGVGVVLQKLGIV